MKTNVLEFFVHFVIAGAALVAGAISGLVLGNLMLGTGFLAVSLLTLVHWRVLLIEHRLDLLTMHLMKLSADLRMPLTEHYEHFKTGRRTFAGPPATEVPQ